jgi:L-fuconolactonase
MKIADAHVHFFRGGYRRPGLPSLFGDGELRAYEALRVAHEIELALAIGYEAGAIDPGNNAHLRDLAASRDWLKTLAFVPPDPPPSPSSLESLIEAGHAGLAIYALDEGQAEAVPRWPPDGWRALESRRAIVSFNSRPEAIARLGPLIARWPGIPFLFSHLGLPGVVAPAGIAGRLKPLLGLAPLPNVHVKISGLYAASAPPHAYPHESARDIVRTILDAFGPARCLWASDFAPAMEFVSFPQTLAGPGCDELGEDERRGVFHDNLARLLARG